MLMNTAEFRSVFFLTFYAFASVFLVSSGIYKDPLKTAISNHSSSFFTNLAMWYLHKRPILMFSTALWLLLACCRWLFNSNHYFYKKSISPMLFVHCFKHVCHGLAFLLDTSSNSRHLVSSMSVHHYGCVVLCFANILQKGRFWAIL